MLTADSLAQDLLVDFGLTEPLAQSAPLDDPVVWMEREFYIPERLYSGDPAIKLEPYQQAVIREAYRRDASGKFVYDLVLWGDIKKSIKSSIAAAVILHRALSVEWGSLKIVANDLEQANSRVFFYITRALTLNPRLGQRALVRNYKISLDNHTTITALPVDPAGEAGGNDDFIEFTELHAAKGKASMQMWTEMTIPPTKHGYGQRWIDTYAGHSGEAPILEQLYDEVVTQGRQIPLPDAPADLEVYASGRMLALWNTRPRMAWQTPEYYASEAKILLPSEFDRIHGNKWVSSEDVFVPAAWWEACKGQTPALDKYTEMVVALDAGVSNDCFAIVALVRVADKVAPVFVRKWQPKPGQALKYSNPADPEDQDYPEGVVRWLASAYNVIGFAYDPYQLHHLCTSLSDEAIGYFVSFNQGQERLVADKQLYDVIRDRRIIHGGNPDLTEHILNANRKAEGENRLRIIKRSDKLKIDLCVALSMGTALAYQLLPE